MAQLRQDYQEFVDRQAEVVVVAPEDQPAVQKFWEKEGFPFVGLADPTHAVASRYGQEVSLLRFGRMPAMMVIDKVGQIRYKHYGGSDHDIPKNQAILTLLDRLNQSDAAE
jgi:peroxiredoxin Q/BCP